MSYTTRRAAAAVAISLALLLASAERATVGGGGVVVKGAARTAAEALPGLWGFEQVFGPAVRGELTIDARGETWLARVGGYEVPVTRAGDEVRFRLPGNAGEFRGRRAPGAKTVNGHWIQPPGAGNNGSPRATPVELFAGAPSVWRGTVAPLDETIAYYVSINRREDGTLSAFVRDPVTNHFRGRTFTVETKDAGLRFTFNGENVFEGKYDAESDTLALPLMFGRAPLRFTRRAERDAVGFYPRVMPHAGPYVYRQPVADGDGWPTATLAEVGLDPKPIAALVEKILNAQPALGQLKLGQLYLAGGVWQGRRVVGREWVKDSVARHSEFKPAMDIDTGHGYGYAWHVRDHKAGGRVFHDYYAGGNGGQFIIVVPALDLVVGFTGGDYGEARKFYRWEIELLPQYIIPAAL